MSNPNPSHAVMTEEIARLREAVKALRATMEDYVNKVEFGIILCNKECTEFRAVLEQTKDLI